MQHIRPQEQMPSNRTKLDSQSWIPTLILPAFGADCRILSVTDQVCQVLPYHQDYQPFDEVPIVQAATAYDDPNTGITYILIINQALQIPHLETTLLNPNQMKAHGLIVDDIPKHLLPNPTELSHSIYCPHEKVNTP